MSIPSGPCLTTSRSGPSDAGEVGGRHHGGGADRDQQVDDTGDREPSEQHARIGPPRLLGLLGDVDRVLEADQGVEGERRPCQGRDQNARALLELEGPADLRVALTQGDGGDEHDQEEAAELDQREADVDLHRLRDSPQVDDGDQPEQAEPGDDRLDLDEDAQIIAAEGARERRRRGHPGRHHGERDEEGEQAVSVGPVHVEGRAAGVRVLGDELRVGAGGEDGHHERESKRRPDRAARLRPDLADQRVDAAAEDVADDEQQEQTRRDGPPQLRPLRARRGQRRLARDRDASRTGLTAARHTGLIPDACRSN